MFYFNELRDAVMKKILVSIVLIIMCIGLCSCFPEEPVFYIFEDINECENIEKLKSDDATVTVYDTPSADKNLGDLQYDDFYCASYESDDLDFEIFAYDFVDSDTAKEYFRKETGLHEIRDTHFLASGGTKYRIIVLDDDRGYITTFKTHDLEEVKTFLTRVFSKKIEIENSNESSE